MPNEARLSSDTRRGGQEFLDRFRLSFANFQPTIDLCQAVSRNEKRTIVSGLAGSSASFLIAELAKTASRPALIITASPDEAVDLSDDLRILLGDRVAHYPARQILPFDFRPPQGEIIGQRLAALSMLTRAGNASEPPIIVAPLRAILEPTITRTSLEKRSLSLSIGDEYDMDLLIDHFADLGFRRVPLVEEVGDFARRGGVLDFFSPGFEAPVRVEFFGDEIESLRGFDVATQRTTETLRTVNLLPKREITLTQKELEYFLDRIPAADAELLQARYVNDPELPGLEWLSLLFGMPQGRMTDFLEHPAWTYVTDHRRLEEEFASILDEGRLLHGKLRDRFSSLPDPESYYLTWDTFESWLGNSPLIDSVPFKGSSRTVIPFDFKPQPTLSSRLDLLGKEIERFESDGYLYILTADYSGLAERLSDLLSNKAGIQITEQLPIVVADFTAGFASDDGRFALYTDHEIFQRHHRRIRKKRFREGVAIEDYHQLDPGNLVVHEDYGIARYLGLETLHIDNRRRDCLLLQFASTDKVYVPLEEFNRVGKYAGNEAAPPLTKLGGPQWEKLKAKAEKAVDAMAQELLGIYAKRYASKRPPLGDDSIFVKQLESSFPYEETTDQLKAIADVRADFSQDRPMDRLVCGDVGFGKTEVAIRAAFKMIDAGKQVALLVPTTILAQQHFETFSERLSPFGAKIAQLSRFVQPKDQKVVLSQLAAGQIDMVIGTHRLLSSDVKFRNLGLLIIDEEHRFGVRHKETIRSLRSSIDTMAMTATPIPRTLHMSLTGVRDLSLIATSPKDRLPIITEVVEFDPEIVRNAILREIDRGGQVFFVHNRVQTIESMYEYLKSIVPKAEIVIAHGQMHEKGMEEVMLAFMAGRFNILLTTTIIESGLDIPNANTIIINRADRFGLAQLYQLRGRVGRSSRRAYAYFLTPPTRMLTLDAMKRLRALEAHSNLGAGFALAMRDLEIRGAGNLLGKKQSGHIEEIGFELYTRMLEEKIAALKGEEIHRRSDLKLDIDLEMHLPDSYIPDSQQRVDIYRRLADAEKPEDVSLLREEVRDRFGKLPESSQNLFDVAALKIVSTAAKIAKVRVRDGRAGLQFVDGAKLTREMIAAIHRATTVPLEYSFTGATVLSANLTKLPLYEQIPHLASLIQALVASVPSVPLGVS